MTVSLQPMVIFTKMLPKSTCRILMCRPTYYDVFYSLNPWMQRKDPVDKEKAMKQWNTLKETIEKCGGTVEVMEPTEDAKDLPDLVFTANSAIVRGKQAYIANFYNRERKGESKINEKWFRENGFKTHFNPDIIHEGTGDALWCGKDRKLLISAVGQRSSVRALKDIYQKLHTEGDDFRIMGVRLADPRFYHLDTALCPLNENIALWFPDAFEHVCQFNMGNKMELLPVTEAEARCFACNSVVVGKNVIMNEGSDRIPTMLEQHGFKVHFISMSEYIKSGGSAKCLTLRLD
ncbi:unnamed protein product [Nippostrongylus brasiliensis]|uniref:Amidinotransferase n=1 Tax=Nippostrongylus brasiliensis TaxID=27835 RepID=A0A0N4XU01_NIPBR|nr:unnamed protein product [Nippostrongylus brasiliensis]